MKIALYIEDGLEQIVLTPETDTEKSILAKLHDGDREMHIRRGSFYSCQGGWVRQREMYDGSYGPPSFGGRTDDSTMIVLEKRTHDREGNPIEAQP